MRGLDYYTRTTFEVDLDRGRRAERGGGGRPLRRAGRVAGWRGGSRYRLSRSGSIAWRWRWKRLDSIRAADAALVALGDAAMRRAMALAASCARPDCASSCFARTRAKGADAPRG